MKTKHEKIDRTIKWIFWICVLSFSFNFLFNILISLLFRWHNVWALIWEPSWVYLFGMLFLAFVCYIKKLWMILIFLIPMSAYIILSSSLILIGYQSSALFLNFINYPDAIITLLIPVFGLNLLYLKFFNRDNMG